ncbi:MAG: TRAP transporter permease [Alphaproteobacteria bacterium]
MSDAAIPRTETGAGPRLLRGLAAVIALAHIWFNTFATWSELHISALHFGMFALVCTLIYPLGERRAGLAGRLLRGLGWTLGGLAVAVSLYLIAFEDALYARGQDFSTADWIAAALSVLLILEFTRRTSGWLIPILTVLALSYMAGWWDRAGGMLAFPGLPWESVLYRAYFSVEGMFGAIAGISWSFVFMFILFGAFLVRSGAGEFIIDLARAAAGRLTGGPGLVAVLSSGLMGSVTGSAVANAASTGVITIPMMKRAGFPARFAAGVEAAASTGGQLMPPIMGAGAFIMATYTQTSYLTIIAAALVPALLYFLSVIFHVRIEAKRMGLAPRPGEGVPLSRLMRTGWTFLIPLAVLIGTLIAGFTPAYAAGFGILSAIAASWAGPRPMNVSACLDATEQAVRTMAPTAMLLIGVGLVVMAINATGVGNTFSLMVTEWAGGSLFLTIGLVAVASLILGMGLPVTAAYVVLATLAAPALQGLILDGQLAEAVASGALNDQAKAILTLGAPDAAQALGAPMSLAEARALLDAVPAELLDQLKDAILPQEAVLAALLSAHFIIFWLSQDSNVTPPVCLAAFTAASIAGSGPMRSGLTAWRIAKGLYVLPLLFAFTPLVGGGPAELVPLFLFTSVGLYAFAAAFLGYLEGPLSWPWRAGAAVCALALLWPHEMLWLSLAGLAGFAALFVHSRSAEKRALQTS